MKYFSILFLGLLIVSCQKEARKDNVVKYDIKSTARHSLEDNNKELAKLINDFIRRRKDVQQELITASPEEANLLYQNYLDKNGYAIADIEKLEQHFVDNYYSYFGESRYRKSVPDTILYKKNLITSAQLEVGDIGEGMVEIRTVPDFYLNLFDKYVTDDYREFITIHAEEDKVLFNDDAAIDIPLEDVGKRVITWENFLAKYPDSDLFAEAQGMYVYYQVAYFFGADNTPVVDYSTAKVYPENLADFKKFVAKYPDSPTTRLIKSIMAHTGTYHELLEIIKKEQQNMGLDTGIYEGMQ